MKPAGGSWMKWTGFCAATLSLALAAGFLDQAPAQPKADIKPPSLTDKYPPKAPAKLRQSVDLAVTGIFGSPCRSCDLSGLDALLMGQIDVHVKENGVAGNYKNPQFEILVTYFDVSAGELKKISKQGSFPQVNQVAKITVVNHPVLARKSTGIKAEVAPIPSPGCIYEDVVSQNNAFTVNMCYNAPLE
jgi:hypothetical protein